MFPRCLTHKEGIQTVDAGLVETSDKITKYVGNLRPGNCQPLELGPKFLGTPLCNKAFVENFRLLVKTNGKTTPPLALLYIARQDHDLQTNAK
jgi:hypothetical protein